YDLFKYMSGILKNDKAFPLAVNGWTDHVHVLFELPMTMSISDQMQRLKTASSIWINENKFLSQKFEWQGGYSAFSCSKGHRHRAIEYIINQETHHGKKSFREEYLETLQQQEVSYDPKYVFEFYDE
ncbi:MAG: transposase, partial [Flavobacteriales bacterium]